MLFPWNNGNLAPIQMQRTGESLWIIINGIVFGPTFVLLDKNDRACDKLKKKATYLYVSKSGDFILGMY